MKMKGKVGGGGRWRNVKVENRDCGGAWHGYENLINSQYISRPRPWGALQISYESGGHKAGRRRGRAEWGALERERERESGRERGRQREVNAAYQSDDWIETRFRVARIYSNLDEPKQGAEYHRTIYHQTN